jgi:hypothetical protein
MIRRSDSRSAVARGAEITFVGSCSTVFAAIAICAALVVLHQLGLG